MISENVKPAAPVVPSSSFSTESQKAVLFRPDNPFLNPTAIKKENTGVTFGSPAPPAYFTAPPFPAQNKPIEFPWAQSKNADTSFHPPTYAPATKLPYPTEIEMQDTTQRAPQFPVFQGTSASFSAGNRVGETRAFPQQQQQNYQPAYQAPSWQSAAQLPPKSAWAQADPFGLGPAAKKQNPDEDLFAERKFYRAAGRK